MRLGRLVHAAWVAGCRPRSKSFARALGDPESAQLAILKRLVRSNARCAFGVDHGFDRVDGPERFRRSVPIASWAEVEPWVDRIRRGERRVLTHEPALRLVPTGGSSRGPKLVPWTRGLGAEFGRAIAPWIVDLNERFPTLRDGPAYWSVSPAIDLHVESRVPVGFDDDDAYLGGPLRHVAQRTLAVPGEVARIRSVEAFQWATLLLLLRARELRLISVWHPSFLGLLLDRLPRWWDGLLEDLARGTLSPPGGLDDATRRVLAPCVRPAPSRARELRTVAPGDAPGIWPRLSVVSCWTDAHAARSVPALARLVPQARIEPKGLVATEAIVSVPFRGRRPVAVTSHFFEFLDDAERPFLLHELRDGAEYVIVVTTAGGLWRYRLGDRVRVEGFAGRTPSLRFLGREDTVSDRVGEKLCDAQVAAALRDVLDGSVEATFAMVAPDGDEDRPRYTLYLELDGEIPAGLAARLDQALAANPYYAHARRFGQLAPVAVFRIDAGAHAAYAHACTSLGRRLGSVKEIALSPRSGWTEVFDGDYVVLG